MNILLIEIRKILNWKVLLVLAAMNIILYYFLIEFHIEYFPNGRPALDSYKIGAQMVEKYGPEMDIEEITDFKKQYKTEVQKADEFFQSREDFQQIGITSYEEFRNADHDDKSVMELHNQVVFEEEMDLLWELQERERLLEYHRDQQMIIENEIARADSAGKNHLNDLKASGQYDLYPEVSLMNFQDIILNIAIAVLLSVVILISPIFLSDRTKNVVDLQYTSKIGRYIFKKKIGAGIISAFLVMTALLAIYLSLYRQNNPEIFFDVSINSFIGEGYWYHLNFFQYIVLTIIAIYVMGIILTLVAMGISNNVPTYIALIGVQVPIIFALLIIGLRSLVGRMISIGLPIWFVPFCYIALLTTVIIILARLWRREKKLDIIQ